MINISVNQKDSPLRLKTLLINWGISQAYWKKLKVSGRILVNGEPVNYDFLLKDGDKVAFSFLPEHTALEPEAEPLTVLYEDDVLLAVHKPAGLLTHNASGIPSSCLTRRVAYYYKVRQIGAGIHPVSRLDKETSGLVLFAKNACIHHMLLFSSMEKQYIGITEGVWQEKNGIIQAPIERKPGSIIERMVSPKGREAVTRYEVLSEKNGQSLLRFTLLTGRTHQIRVHCAYAGHPLAGDTLYGTRSPQGRHLLHACQLCLVHPLTREKLIITDPLPDDIKNWLEETK
jgi:23S rRNA pseudouridine1911/1915/1917 synthase